MSAFTIKNLNRIVFAILFVLILVLASATILEKLFGTEWVHDYIYGAWWFILLWGVLFVFAFIYIFSCKLWRKPAVFMLHCSFGVILLGALITYLYANRGYMHIRQGETENTYVSETGQKNLQLPFDVKLILFDIEYHPNSDEAANYISFLKANDEIRQISMNKIMREKGYRFYQYDYDSDEMGTTLLVNHDPWGIGITYTGYLLLAVSMLWILWQRMGWKGILGIFIPTLAIWLYISRINPMTPILRTPMLAAHVSIIMASYGLLFFFMLTGCIGLCSSRLSLKFFQWNTRLLYSAVFLLAAGIFIGAIWANISWGRYWGWDAKEVWALITMLLYAIPMHTKSIPAFKNPRTFHLYCILAFLSVAMTFFGVTYLLGGIHSYV